MFIVYVIKSESTGKIYVGQTQDLIQRLKRHNKELPYKESGYTAKNKGPWKLVYSEEYKMRKEAIDREKYLKSHVGRNYLKSLIIIQGV